MTALNCRGSVDQKREATDTKTRAVVPSQRRCQFLFRQNSRGTSFTIQRVYKKSPTPEKKPGRMESEDYRTAPSVEAFLPLPSSSSVRVMHTEVVNINPAIEAAYFNALVTTFAGSTTPALYMSPYSRV